jgi:hypothetical protein
VNVVHLPGFARKPEGDMILCDVARPDASIIVEELRQLGIARVGSISMEPIETQVSDAADAAHRALEELPFGDAVVWEEVEARTSEETRLSINFIEFMMIAALIAAVGILLIGVETAYTDWAEVGGAAAQLGVNLVALVLGGLARLTVQRRVYEVRLKRHSSGSTSEP